ncbi:hypothetical protein [Pseudarthrobacter sp. LT1]|uniref:hypothetical protein n=1 Tax=Pseudarthrobacter sp. LT1 TaxID=3111450 RepID=UPI002D79D6C0|nr:hypothetical protein [Pseudarthrobacter sp. LT1]WRT12612.1 hypothetical protein VIK36_14755 [Pseudarthrobacter sp. LT1]
MGTKGLPAPPEPGTAAWVPEAGADPPAGAPAAVPPAEGTPSGAGAPAAVEVPVAGSAAGADAVEGPDAVGDSGRSVAGELVGVAAAVVRGPGAGGVSEDVGLGAVADVAPADGEPLAAGSREPGTGRMGHGVRGALVAGDPAVGSPARCRLSPSCPDAPFPVAP